MKRKKIQVLLSAIAFLLLLGVSVSAFAQVRKVGRMERRADRNFISQKFDKAMSQYEVAVKRVMDDDSKAALHLKVARLYFMVRDYKLASEHYGQAIELRPNILGMDDVCEYVDALRFQGKIREAEAICLNNAYKNIYSRSQRYQNTLEALAMSHSIQEEPGYSAKRLSMNSGNSEYWVGIYGDQPFYAMSYSQFNDPRKTFFHRTLYYELDANEDAGNNKSQKPPKRYDYFNRIPADLQNGPVTFSSNMDMMVTTVIEYDIARTSVAMADKKFRPFRTKLYYSILKNEKSRFSRYIPVLPQESVASYAHPYLFNNGKSLLFASDMAGGHGGFDLYVVHWNDETQSWGALVNLGAEINTEGDEIFPVFFKGRLIFSSNGLAGFGGYDLFSCAFDKDGIMPGGVSHYPYPVNSVFNDYYMCPIDLQSAYFVSDRAMESQDDIYYLRTMEDLGVQREKPFYGMSEEMAVLGGSLLLKGATENVRKETVSLKKFVPDGLLLTLYFNFDSDALTEESVRRLNVFAEEMGGYDLSELKFDGYADEMGSANYNYELSGRRAQRVAEYLRELGVDVNFMIEARGRTKLSPEEVKEEVGSYVWKERDIDWIRVNRRARRVEIYNKR
ncbi:OmpA family protein [Bacteroides sp. UBA939]|uniref:OmpA family protein n=1 Tax=Bacteroides sp. UBA939 TaxID=1946092 RepID=UPI0025C6D7C6|nr:OmpA family protein [Bacteroides sp. UBA939]